MKRRSPARFSISLIAASVYSVVTWIEAFNRGSRSHHWVACHSFAAAHSAAPNSTLRSSPPRPSSGIIIP